MAEKQIVWLIEDSKDEAEKYGRFLEAAGRINIKFIDAKSRPSLSDYAVIATNKQTGAVLIDQRLSLSGVSYDGIDIATFLRSIKPDLPIYFLTQWPEDLQGIGEVVDWIIPKAGVRKSAREYVAKIQGAMQQYQKALTERARRLSQLIDRKLTGKITPRESKELERLRLEIERPHAIEEFRVRDKWNQTEKKERELLQAILKELETLTRRTRQSGHRSPRRITRSRRKK